MLRPTGRLGAPLLCSLLLALTACRAIPPLEEFAPWVPLFEGPALEHWIETPFGGGGEVRWEGGALWLDFGSPMTGVTWTGEFPREEYQVELSATRLEGNDFFCGLTFPVGDQLCTLILGGWGGALTGLSCLDGEDASTNATKSFRHYPAGEPVVVRLEVSPEVVRVLLDGEESIAVARPGVRFSLRDEVLPSAPFGLASFATRARIEGLRYRTPGGGAPTPSSPE